MTPLHASGPLAAQGLRKPPCPNWCSPASTGRAHEQCPDVCVHCAAAPLHFNNGCYSRTAGLEERPELEIHSESISSFGLPKCRRGSAPSLPVPSFAEPAWPLYFTTRRQKMRRFGPELPGATDDRDPQLPQSSAPSAVASPYYGSGVGGSAQGLRRFQPLRASMCMAFGTCPHSPRSIAPTARSALRAPDSPRTAERLSIPRSRSAFCVPGACGPSKKEAGRSTAVKGGGIIPAPDCGRARASRSLNSPLQQRSSNPHHSRM